MRNDIKSIIGAENINVHANPVLTVQEGIKTEAVSHIEEITGIGKKHLFKIIGFTDKTYTRRLAHKNLKESESDRLYTFIKIFKHAVEVFGSFDKARTWLYTPLSALDNHKPINICHTIQGMLQVDEILYRIQHGIFS